MCTRAARLPAAHRGGMFAGATPWQAQRPLRGRGMLKHRPRRALCPGRCTPLGSQVCVGREGEGGKEQQARQRKSRKRHASGVSADAAAKVGFVLASERAGAHKKSLWVCEPLGWLQATTQIDMHEGELS
mmetsp:Transcript_45570/g.130596  ORF Transcript_45570/g.130596 Transcript_45570/m.130596 type:complete len:130 (-) Transcript_45570:361-750(-)